MFRDWECVTQNIAPLKMWLLESVNRLLYMAKGTLQMEMKGLEMERLSWLAQCNHKGFFKSRQEGQSQRKWI